MTTTALAEQAHAAGAQFFVTPHLTSAVNAYALQHNAGLVCGAFSPSEIAAALGEAYVKALVGPYPADLELMVVGGIG